MDKKTFGRRMFRARRAKGITSDRLAEKLGMSGSYIRQLECGNRQPSIEMLINLCNELEVSSDYLLRGELSVDRKEQFDAMDAKLRTLSKRQLKMIDQFIDAVTDNEKTA